MIKHCSELKNNIYPIESNNTNEICFLGDISPYKNFFGFKTFKQTANQLDGKINHEALEKLTLIDDTRLFENEYYSNRKWNHTSLPTRMKITAYFAILKGIKVFSYPYRNFLYPKHLLKDIWHVIAVQNKQRGIL
jgi:hypothetical protein